MDNKLETIKRDLQSAEFKLKFQNASQEMDFVKETGFALQSLQDNSYLAQASRDSILKSIYNVALTGITLNPTMRQAYLVPRKKNGEVVACLDIGYQGLISKMIDTGQAKDVYAEVVYEGDSFDITFGTERTIQHKPYYIIGKEKGKELGTYAVAILPDGSKKFEFMPMEKVNSIMEMSESYKADKRNQTKHSVWSGVFRENMIKKTAIKNLWNYMPKNKRAEEIANIIAVDNETNEFNLNAREPVKVDKNMVMSKGYSPIEMIEDVETKTVVQDVEVESPENISKIASDTINPENVQDVQEASEVPTELNRSASDKEKIKMAFLSKYKIKNSELNRACMNLGYDYNDVESICNRASDEEIKNIIKLCMELRI